MFSNGRAGQRSELRRPDYPSTALSALLVFTLMLLTACSAGVSQPQATAQPDLSVLPSLAELEAMDADQLVGPRASSVVLDTKLPGDDVFVVSPLVVLDQVEHVAVMHTSFTGFSYAIYKFTGFNPGEYPLSFSIERSEFGKGRTPSDAPPPYSIAYAAWADFGAGRWRLFPDWMPYTDPVDSWEQLYPEDAAAVSATANSYLAVIMYGPTVESPVVISVTLHYTGDAT